MKKLLCYFFPGLIALLLTINARGQGLNPQAQLKLDQIVSQAREWVKATVLLEAVENQNRQLPVAYASMTQETWESLPDADPFVRAFTTNPAAEFLKQKKTPAITEAFLSDANGVKVAFLAKTTNWSHKGKPKHDVPMSGQTWQGKIEVDRSTGGKQLQVSVPVLVDGKAVGSLVLGVSTSALVAE